MSTTGTTIDAYWQQMVTVALLGTDRRDPPVPPDGGLADLAADEPLPSPSQRLLQQVSACTAVRRAGVLPGPAAALVAPPAADPRAVTPPSATVTWRRIVGDWPVLEDEWVLAVVRSGHRLAPELVPPLLARHRTDAVRHARVRAAAGPLGEWMIEWSPRLACSSKQRAVPELVAEVPELQITPELVPLLAAPPRDVVAAVVGGMAAGRLVTSHRAVLVNFVARVAPITLVPLAAALRRLDPALPSIGIAFALADLAHLRRHLLTELEPS
jgi:hypothetical protein